MWFLIEVEGHDDVGHDENKRYIINDNRKICNIKLEDKMGVVNFSGTALAVHPCTAGDEGYHCHICHRDVQPRTKKVQL